MKPRPMNVTREFGGSQRQPEDGWPTDSTDQYDDPEDKTPVAPPPSLAMLADAGAPWYSRHRYPLAGAGGLLLIALAFLTGMRTSSHGEPSPAADAAPLLPAVAPPPPLKPPV